MVKGDILKTVSEHLLVEDDNNKWFLGDGPGVFAISVRLELSVSTLYICWMREIICDFSGMLLLFHANQSISKSEFLITLKLPLYHIYCEFKDTTAAETYNNGNVYLEWRTEILCRVS